MRSIRDGGFLFEVHNDTRGCWSVTIIAGGPPTRMCRNFRRPKSIAVASKSSCE